MAKLSNINGKFAVEDTGAIRFSDQTGTTGQILKSNGNSAPTWVDPNTVGTGPWLPLAGGVVSGATTFQSSLTVGGTLTVNGSGGSVFNSTGASNHIIAAYRASNGNNVATFRTTDSGYIFRIHAQNAGTIYVQNDDGSNYIKIPDSGSNEVSGNTTFAGTVLIDGLSNYTGLTVKGAGASRPAILFENANQGSLGMIYATEGDAIVINTGSDAVTIDSSGNVGIGVTPFAHTLSTSASLDLKGFGGIWGYAGATYVNSNAYYDSGWKYKTTAPAAVLQVGGSSQELTFRQAVSGTAGNAITYTQPFTIDTSGKVGIGTISPSEKLSVVGGNIRLESTVAGSNGVLIIYDSNTTQSGQIYGSSGDLKIYSPADVLFNQGGNVGINATDPVKTLDVRGSLAISNSTGSYWYMDRNDATGDFDLNENINGTLFSVSTNGLGSFVNTSIGDKLLLAGDNAASARGLMFNCSTTTNQGDTWDIDAQSATGIIKFSTGSSEKMRITSGGHVLLGNTTVSLTSGTGFKFIKDTFAPYIGLVVNSSAATGNTNYHYYNTNTSYNGFRFYIANNGGIYNFAANNVNLSDERVKHNIENSGNYLDKICSIPVRLFNYKDEPEGTNKNLGVIAQEVEAIAPELVNNDGFGETPEDGIELKTVYSNDMMYALMKAVQELKADNDILKARIKILENK